MKRKATAYPERLCLPSLSTSSSSSLTARSVPDSIDGYSSNTSRSILSRSESTAGRHGLQSAKSVQSIQTEPEQDRIVGTLTGVVRGEQVVIYIHSTSSYTVIGSDATCNVRLWDQDVSRKHMRIYSIRTDSALMVTCLHDISVNGFTINGSRFRSRTPISVGQRKVYTQAAILMDGDVLRFAGTSYQFVYEHNFQDFPLPCHSASPIEEFGQLPDPIFGPNDDPRDKYDAHPWIIHNYQLGSGAYAYVNLASHKAGGLQVACKTVKMLTEEVDEEEETSDGDSLQSWTTEGSSSTKRKKDVQAYLEEVKTLRVLCHPNVAALLDVIHDPEQSRVHVFMELVTGGDLFSHLERSTLTEGEVAFLAYQLCKGIGYLHELRLAHRDIKPENILLAVSDAYPKVVITDFGHAISETQLLELIPLNPDEFCARIYPVTGTIEYLPRERLIALLRPPRGVQGTLEEVGIGWAEKRNQIAGKWLEEEFALDSWALGCVLYTACAGTHPYIFQGDEDGNESLSLPTQVGSAWAEFRRLNGSKTIGQSSSCLLEEKQKVDVEKAKLRLDAFLTKTHWKPEQKWDSMSKDLTLLIAAMLQRMPYSRLKMESSEFHDYFINRAPELKRMYSSVVIHGGMWPDRS